MRGKWCIRTIRCRQKNDPRENQFAKIEGVEPALVVKSKSPPCRQKRDKGGAPLCAALPAFLDSEIYLGFLADLADAAYQQVGGGFVWGDREEFERGGVVVGAKN